MNGEPFSEAKAKALLRSILTGGTVWFSGHAKQEMANDGLTMADAFHVLRAGQIPAPAEQVNGTWRYRVRTNKAVFVVAFRNENECTVVTAWRLNP